MFNLEKKGWMTMRRNRKILLCFLFLICLILAGTLECIYQYGQSGGEKASADVVDGMNIIGDDYLFTGTPHSNTK